MDADGLGQLIASQREETAFQQWLHRQNIDDPARTDFALAQRSRGLRIQGTGGVENPKVRLLVTAIAVPKPPWRELWAASNGSIYSWLKDQARRYEPFNQLAMFPNETKAMHGGVLMATSDGRSDLYARRYIAIERTGIVELGLGTDACMLHGDEKSFLLTPIVAYVWHMVGFVSDLYAWSQQSQPFTLLVNLRETENALLGGLAEGWRGPWGVDGFKKICAEPNVQLRHDNLGPALDAESGRQLATEIAFEIEAAWGMGGPNVHPRCFIRKEDGTRGDFDLSMIR
jgi:hypothetical protein